MALALQAPADYTFITNNHFARISAEVKLGLSAALLFFG
jgi:hypothetical protein